MILRAHIKARKRNSTTRSKNYTYLLLQKRFKTWQQAIYEQKFPEYFVVYLGTHYAGHCICAGIVAIIARTFSLSFGNNLMIKNEVPYEWEAGKPHPPMMQQGRAHYVEKLTHGR